MSESIFSGYGIEILKREGRFYIRYDAGELVIEMEEIEVTEEEVNRAKKSEQDAYEIILAKQQNIRNPGTDHE